jgi:hypothetical protein
MKKDKIEKRRRHVEELFFLRGVPIDVCADLLGCCKATIRDDCQTIKERWLEKAQMTSEGAVEAVEEVAGLIALAHNAMHEAEMLQHPTPSMKSKDAIKAKVRLMNTAARCLFLAGRLKQGHDE